MKRKSIVKKVYGEDTRFALIYEKIKIGVPISVEMRDYFNQEKKHYDLSLKL